MSFISLDPVPAGVEVVKDYPTLKGTLVQCTHDKSHRTEMFGRPWCPICKADEATTESFELPVKFMAVLPDDPGQVPLFAA